MFLERFTRATGETRYHSIILCGEVEAWRSLHFTTVLLEQNRRERCNEQRQPSGVRRFSAYFSSSPRLQRVPSAGCQFLPIWWVNTREQRSGGASDSCTVVMFLTCWSAANVDARVLSPRYAIYPALRVSLTIYHVCVLALHDMAFHCLDYCAVNLSF